MEDVPQGIRLKKLNNIFRGFIIAKTKINYNMYKL